MGHGISNSGPDRSRRKYGMGGAVFPPERAEMSEVWGRGRRRARIPPDAQKPVEGVPMPLWADLQLIQWHRVRPAPSESGPSGFANARDSERRDDLSPVTRVGPRLRDAVEFASLATRTGTTLATDKGFAGY